MTDMTSFKSQSMYMICFVITRLTTGQYNTVYAIGGLYLLRLLRLLKLVLHEIMHLNLPVKQLYMYLFILSFDTLNDVFEITVCKQFRPQFQNHFLSKI